MDAVQEVVEKGVKVSQILGLLLLTRCNDTVVCNMGKSSWEDNLNDSRTLPINSTLTLYTDCRLGRDTYMKERKLFKSSGFDILPPWISLSKKQSKITPTVLDLPLPHNGVFFPLIPAVKITMQRIIQNLPENVELSSEVQLTIKFGFDGSGSHSIYNQVNNAQTNNMILTMFCPLSIENNGQILWCQKSPNSPYSQRPLALQMGKESIENLQTLSIFNKPLEHLVNIGFQLSDNITVKIKLGSYMMDRKGTDYYLGVAGAVCDLCSLSKNKCHNINIVSEGINIDRDIDSLHRIFEELVQEDGNILKRKKDYNIRKGVCNKSIATNQAFCIQVLHSLLRCFDSFMKAVVHVKAGVFDWSDAKPEHKIKLGDAKHKLQNKIVEETGVKWDFPDKTGKGGNTTIGNNCKRLIHLERERIISEFPDDHKDTFRYFGQHLSVILIVMSSKETFRIFAAELCM